MSCRPCLPTPRLVYYLRMNASMPPHDESLDDVVTLAVEVLRILADPTRLRIAVRLEIGRAHV